MAVTVRVGTAPSRLPSLTEALEDPAVSEVILDPGRYVEHVVIGPRRAPLLLRSATGDARDTVLSFGLRQGDRDRTGMPYGQDCATLTIDADDVTLEDITVENTFDKTVGLDLPDSQALALRTRGDRIALHRCRLLGRQDTALLDAPSWAAVCRVHLSNCEIVGDVDFIYGRATALIEGGTIRSVGPGYIAAPSTASENPRGFLFHGVRLEADADVPAGSVHLARPWHPGGKPDAIGQAIFSQCTTGPHLAASRWCEMGGFAWEEARFEERGSLRPGDRAPRAGAERPAEVRGWLEAPTPRPGRTARVVVLAGGPARPEPRWVEQFAAAEGMDVLDLGEEEAGTRHYLEAGHLGRSLAQIEPGDLAVIGFDRRDSPRGEHARDVFARFPADLRRFLVGVRAAGACPVLLPPPPDGDGYRQAVRSLAAQEGVALRDPLPLSRSHPADPMREARPETVVPFTAAGDLLRAVHLPGRGRHALHLHGLGCHGAASWADVAVRRGRAALLLDLPGHGRSDAPVDFDYTLPAIADAVARFLAAQGPSPHEVLGHSLGGAVAIHLAHRHPHLVERLVLVEPAVDPVPAQPGDIAAEPEATLGVGGWERLLSRETPERRADVSLTAPVALVRSARALTDEHAARTSDLLQALTQPVTLICGGERRYRDEPAYTDRGIHLRRIAGAGHFVMNDAPAVFLAALDDAAPEDL